MTTPGTGSPEEGRHCEVCGDQYAVPPQFRRLVGINGTTGRLVVVDDEYVVHRCASLENEDVRDLLSALRQAEGLV